jgi:hypothetical protein
MDVLPGDKFKHLARIRHAAVHAEIAVVEQNPAGAQGAGACNVM